MPPFTFTLPTLSTPVFVLLAFTVTTTFLIRKLLPTYKFPSSSPPLAINRLPILGALKFFTGRWKFFHHARDQSKSGNFSFLLGKHPVVGLSGEEGRRLFFESRDMSMREGYAVLFGQSPNNLQEGEGLGSNDKEFRGPGGYFAHRITRLLKTENFSQRLPQLLHDVQSSFYTLAQDPRGITDPFESIYLLVYQLTMRIVGCDEIADDPALLATTLSLFETVESSATATAVLFPWFPSPAIIKRTIAGTRLYLIFKSVIDKRVASGKRSDDPLQYLLDQGDDCPAIVEFIIGALFAGLLNSGINTAWVLLYLSKSPHWLLLVRAEIEAAARNHNPSSMLPLAAQLTSLPLEAWESEFPALDLCLRESIRLQLLGTAFRRNISGRDLPIGNGNGEVVPDGAYVVYAMADIHLDPSIYRDPETWDPSRYLPGRAEDKKVPLGYLGWGAGRHPCLGMRFAKIEQNIITAFFLAKFDFELTDKMGNSMAATPPVDFDGHSAMKPKQKAYLKYKVR